MLQDYVLIPKINIQTRIKGIFDIELCTEQIRNETTTRNHKS